MNRSTYRLVKYRITEYGKNLWWETHIAVGERLRGDCFIHDDILIIGQADHRETGFLIGDFLERLEKAPQWNKTAYYCFASELLDVATGQCLRTDLLEERLSQWKSNCAAPSSSATDDPGAFRLARYRITVDLIGDITWRAYGGTWGAIGGPCTVRSGILFLGPEEYDEQGPSRKEFFAKLHELPLWQRSVLWSYSQALRPCSEERQRKTPHNSLRHQYTRIVKPTGNRDYASQNQPRESLQEMLQAGLDRVKKLRSLLPKRNKRDSAERQNHEGEYLRKILSSGTARLKKVKPRAPWRNGGLKYLVVLVVAGLLFGLLTMFHSVKKFFHRSHLFEEHHHKHNHH
jgi:hypothetical protein